MSKQNYFKRFFFKENNTVQRSTQQIAGKDIKLRRSFDYKALAAYAQAYNIEFNDFNFTDAVERIGVVYQCIDILSNTIARIGFNVITDKQNDGDFEDYKDHPWFKQIKYKPNNGQSDFEFRRMIATAVYTKGNAYAYINRKTLQLEFIHPDLIDDIILVNGIKVYRSTQLAYNFLDHEILHFKKVSTTGLKGLSPLDAVKSNANILHLAERTTEEYYRHGARSPIVIERDLDKTINQDSLDEIIEAMKVNNMSGSLSIREPLVLPPTLRAKELKLTAEDAMFVQTAQYTNEQIANLYGIPSYLIYASKGVAGKYEQERLSFLDTTITNYLEMFKSVMVDKLITLDDRIELNADIVYSINKLQSLDFASISTNVVQLSNNAIISKNEARQWLGLKRVNDKNMDLHLSQGQNLPLEGRDFTTMKPPETAPEIKPETSTDDDNKPTE